MFIGEGQRSQVRNNSDGTLKLTNVTTPLMTRWTTNTWDAELGQCSPNYVYKLRLYGTVAQWVKYSKSQTNDSGQNLTMYLNCNSQDNLL